MSRMIFLAAMIAAIQPLSAPPLGPVRQRHPMHWVFHKRTRKAARPPWRQ